mmetsp:Transcript_1834/g.4797  ORF Transcript_1834/g.4797 Transcript_1834/m.4797 type:complete len:379 (+) Transcript_1834:191-1327(+)|eukprot:jgi/Tetstr1/431691/TSEL_021216.t1
MEDVTTGGAQRPPEELLRVDTVELYQIEAQSVSRQLLFKGPLLVQAFPGQRSSVGNVTLQAVVGQLVLSLDAERCCLEPSPGVFLLSQRVRNPAHFYCIALALPPGIAEEGSDVRGLRMLLSQTCTYQRGASWLPLPQVAAEQPPEKGLTVFGISSVKVSKGIQRSASGVAWGIGATATLVSRGLEAGSKVAVQRGWVSAASERADGPAEVSPSLSRSLSTSKQISSGVCTVATSIASGVATVAGHVARKAVEHAMTSDSGRNWTRSSSFKAASDVASASFSGFGDVMDAMESAATVLFQATSEATTRIVGHRYGEAAAMSTLDGFSTAGNLVGTALALRMLGRRDLTRTMLAEATGELRSNKLAAPALPTVAAVSIS